MSTNKKKKARSFKEYAFEKKAEEQLAKEFKKTEIEDIAPVPEKINISKTQASTPSQYLIGPSTIAPSNNNYMPIGGGNNLAPLSDDKEKWYQGWLKKGEGSLGQTVEASAVDLGGDAATGLLGIFEKGIDSVAALAPVLLWGNSRNNPLYPDSLRETVGKAYEEDTKKASEFVKKDLYNEQELIAKYIVNPHEKMRGINVEDMSVFGHKTDSLAQSAGQMVGTVGASMINPLAGTAMLGATSFGSEMENALNQGATYDESVVSATITAGAEVLSEKLSGGISLGGKTLDEIVPVEKLSQGISSRLVRNLIKTGVDAAGEGFEEIVAGYLGAVGQKLTYMDEKEIEEIFSSEEALDSFLGGFIMGGVSSTGKAAVDTIKGTDSLTGMSKVEKSVFDKAYSDAIEEAKKDGKKLTVSDKNKIFDRVTTDMEKGYIKADVIESVLGGENYKNLQTVIEQEQSIQKEYDTAKAEYDEINKLKAMERTGEQEDRRTELKAQLEEIKARQDEFNARDEKTRHRGLLDIDVWNQVKNTKLAETYLEKDRKGESYTADLSEYTEKEREIVQSAIDSGVLNNTNRTHDFVNFVAKICGAKDIKFNFSNNSRIAESGFAIESKTVNGFVNNGEITLNIQSNKALNSVVGHEITHILEGSDFYGDLQQAIETYARTKGDYDAKMSALETLYKDVKDVDLKKELTADLVGEYLFTDNDFLASLRVEKPSVFQRIYDEVKNLVKMTVAGSNEEKQLLAVQRNFEKALQSELKPIEGDTKYSMSSIGTSFFDNPDISVDEMLEKENGDYKYKQTEGYKNYVEQCLNNVRQTREDFDEESARGEIEKQIEGIVRVAAAAKRAGYDIADYEYDADGKKVDVSKKIDSKGRILFSSLEPNSEYTTSHDVSTICDKRKNFAEIYDDIVRAEQKKGVPEGKRFFDKVDNYFVIHSIMAEKGLTQPCKQCYVESMRKNLTPMATAFRELITETDENNKSNKQLYHASGKNKGQQKVNNAKLRENVQRELANCGMSVDDLTIDMLTTADGLAQLRIQAPLIYELYNSFYGQAKPKMPKKATPFRFGELTALLTDEKGNIKQKLVSKINSTGGFRLQSYSDFQLQNYTDVLQTIFEAGTLGLSGHAYTKVPAFLEATDGTNLKRNISIFMYKDGDTWKLDRNDSFPYTLDEIYNIVNADKSGNTGIIAVSQNEDMSAWIMANNMVAYGIPFHKSGIKMNTVRETIVRTEDGRKIKGYKDIKDHTRQQVETWKTKTEDHNAGTKVKNGINIYEFWDFENTDNLSKQDLIKKNVKKYIDICEERGYYPKFRNYVMDNAKVLENVLKYSKELGFASEHATIDDISFEYRGYRIPYGYYKFLGDFSMFKPDGAASPHEVLSLENYDFDSAERFFDDAEGIRKKELLQQFSNGAIRDDFRRQLEEGKITTEQLQKELEKRRAEVVSDVVGPTYSLGEETAHGGDYRIYGDDIGYAAEETAPVTVDEDIAPVSPEAPIEHPTGYAPLTAEEAAERDAERAEAEAPKVARVLTEKEPVETKKGGKFAGWMELIGDKGFVFENLAKKTKNRRLEARWNSTRNAERSAQHFIGNGAEGIRSLTDIRKEVQEAGIVQELYDYLYHRHNIDRMSLSERFDEMENKPVFGETVTADVSREVVRELEEAHPELADYAEEIYSMNRHLRKMLVDEGVIDEKTAELWEEMYPHYMPIKRYDKNGNVINDPISMRRAGIGAPLKKATGGDSDIEPLFETLAGRVRQTYKAIARNRFGVELKNTLNSVVETAREDVDTVDSGIDTFEELLQSGKGGKNPTFTVFEDGKKVTFEITEDMYNAMMPAKGRLADTFAPLNKGSDLHRKVLTEYNVGFIVRNFLKDTQDIAMNSQHPLKTYGNIPKAIKELTTNGDYYQEYIKNGGEQNTYFDSATSRFFDEEDTGLRKVFVNTIGIPFNLISNANNFIEKVPRLAEYIASRESGADIDVAMLDAARVTTNFSAGGDLTKLLNRNGATFLNASVQGVMQNIRNVREAKMNGLKGYVQLATKCAVVGLPALIMNGLLWDDDEDYEELSDYIKDNFYIVAKMQDGKFVRIPKGRMAAVIQNAFEQIGNMITGNDEADLGRFLDLVANNLAPNNPVEDNIFAPIGQALNNKTWYGEDLIPTRLQDVPAEEQYDESTDSLSKWLGEHTGTSPYKINYLLQQYTGSFGDAIMPMFTPESESGDDSVIGTLTAPVRDSFVADSVLKNQNVTDFYETADELKVQSNSSKATDEDILKNKYFSSKNTEIGKLYGEKREIQSRTDLTDSEKYYLVRELQKQINEKAKTSLNDHANVRINGSYATVGDLHYRLTDNGWTKLTDDQIDKMNEVSKGLGITPAEYWNNKEEYDMQYKYPEKYKVLQEQGISAKEYKELYEESAFIYTDDYDWASKYPDKYSISKAISDDVKVYKQYMSELNEIKADKDSSGKTISGSSKEKKKNYIFSLNLDYGQKAILYRSLYDSKADKEKYNDIIIDYLNERDDISAQEMREILEALDMKIDSKGRITW